jgi:DNA polymerase-3 subunit delta
MAVIDLRTLAQQIQQKKMASPYLFIGEETWISDRAYQMVKRAILVEGLEDFNFKVFYASTAEIEDVIEEINTLPVMCKHRLTVIKEGQALTERDWEKLGERQIPKSTILIVLASSADKRKKSCKYFVDLATVVECKTPYENQKRGWIEALAQEENLILTQEALKYWESQWNFSLSETALELKKIRSFLGTIDAEKKEVSLNDLRMLLPQFSEESVFKFTEAIGFQNFVKARSILHNLIAYGESDIGFVQLLARHGRLLLKVQQGMHRGLKAQSLASFAGVSPYFLTAYTDQARLWTYEALKQWLVKLSQLDIKLKSSRLSSLAHWESLLLDFQDLADNCR